MERVDKHLYAYAEQCLYNHDRNCSELKARKEYLVSLIETPPADYSKLKIDDPNSIKNKESMIDSLFLDEILIKLDRITKTVNDFYNNLPDDEKRFVNLRYFQKLTWNETASILGLSISTTRIRWRQKIVDKIARQLFGYLV